LKGSSNTIIFPSKWAFRVTIPGVYAPNLQPATIPQPEFRSKPPF